MTPTKKPTVHTYTIKQAQEVAERTGYYPVLETPDYQVLEGVKNAEDQEKAAREAASLVEAQTTGGSHEKK